jgi:hypothetical protein
MARQVEKLQQELIELEIQIEAGLFLPATSTGEPLCRMCCMYRTLLLLNLNNGV